MFLIEINRLKIRLAQNFEVGYLSFNSFSVGMLWLRLVKIRPVLRVWRLCLFVSNGRFLSRFLFLVQVFSRVRRPRLGFALRPQILGSFSNAWI